MKTIYIPVNEADQWQQFLADAKKQWKLGFSARTIAHSWQEADGFPDEIKLALRKCEVFSEIELLLAFPEHKVPLPGGSRPSQSDVWALARAGENLVSIAVEGKVEESFGPILSDWLAEGSKGKMTRLAFLRKELNLNEALPGHLRYQLFHRTASAVVEAKRFTAKHAVMLVHSFSQTHEGFEDYSEFVKLLGGVATKDEVSDLGIRAGVHLYLGWIVGNEKYLSR
jgi:hypothetical protein